MKTLDGRHRWDVTAREGARITHTCRVCGRTETVEVLIREDFVAAVIEVMSRPSPYRAMVR